MIFAAAVKRSPFGPVSDLGERCLLLKGGEEAVPHRDSQGGNHLNGTKAVLEDPSSFERWRTSTSSPYTNSA